MNININSNKNSLKVVSQGQEILMIDSFPVKELFFQLSEWINIATEENGKSFIFRSLDQNLTGIFRIEARPNGWQFTSSNEKKRSKELLPLSEWKTIIDQLSIN